MQNVDLDIIKNLAIGTRFHVINFAVKLKNVRN